MGKITKLIILDRDGVINFDSDRYIKSPEEWQPIPGSLEAIAQQTLVCWVHVGMAQAGGRIEAIFFCPDTSDSNSPNRKPRPGMNIAIGERFNVPLDGVPCVGDSLRDLQAAAAVGARPILVLTGKGAKTQKEGGLPPGTDIHPDLAAVAAELCA